MRWIDTHVHLFTDNDKNNNNVPRLFATENINTVDYYLESLKDNKPDGIVSVDFSKAPTSENVIASLDVLKNKNIKASAIIKGNLSDDRTIQWLQRDDVKGVRLYALTDIVDFSQNEWDNIRNILIKDKKHILIFGKGKNLTKSIDTIDKNITILVDHLAMPKSAQDSDFINLLKIAKERGNIYFKGPGYRTSLNEDKIIQILLKIKQYVGIEKLILGTSDAPFAGPVTDDSPEYKDKLFGEYINFSNIVKFINKLATSIANNENDIDRLLYKNAKDIYNF